MTVNLTELVTTVDQLAIMMMNLFMGEVVKSDDEAHMGPIFMGKAEVHQWLKIGR